MNRVGSMMRRYDQKQNPPPQAAPAHAKGTDSSSAAREARHPVLHPPLTAGSRDAPAPPSLPRSVAEQDTPLSREAPRLPYDLPQMPIARPSPPVIQAKLAIGASGDGAEEEADSIADRVMRMPRPTAHLAASDDYLLKSKYSKEVAARPANHPQILARQQVTGGELRNGTPAPPIVHDGLRSPSQPLDPSTRAFMEPRFGHDFCQVRVHTDAVASQSARAIQAQAYTVGNDVVFDAGRYAPESDSGRGLLAHELSHVLQQQSAPVIQRQPAGPSKPSVGVQVLQNPLIVAVMGQIVAMIPNASDYLEREILIGMLASPRNLNLSGTEQEQGQKLRAHVAARKGIVFFAEENQFSYSTDPKFNEEYWENAGGFELILKPGKNRKEAYNDLHVHPDKYELECNQATAMTMQAGSDFAKIVRDENVPDWDWIPGDWGDIKNTGKGKIGDGEFSQNIIYLGRGLFWGIASGETVRTYEEWYDHVKDWNRAAELHSYRKRPIF